jgi:hypothetical protein
MLNLVIPLGERHFRGPVAKFIAHYHGERNQQRLGNELINPLQRLPAASLVADCDSVEF